MGKSKAATAPRKTDEDKAAEKAAKAREKALAEFVKNAKAGERSKVEAAVAAGIDINHANEKGQTAAHMAAAFGHRKLLQFLHRNGADFTLVDLRNLTPVAVARFVGETEAAQLMEALLEGKEVEVADESDEDGDDEDPEGSASARATSASGVLVSRASKGRRRPPEAAATAESAPPASSAVSGDTSCTPAGVEVAPIDMAPYVLERFEDIEKSASDQRAYRWLRLSNTMQVMLVSDPSCDYAAAAMDVGIGSASDPEDLPGLAHFLEHMLFLGTEKYPAEHEYTAYLEEHGGESNAFTAHEDTHYYFDVQPAYLQGALDRFAQVCC